MSMSEYWANKELRVGVDNDQILDYDWLILHQDEFLSESECGIISHELLEELMDNEADIGSD